MFNLYFYANSVCPHLITTRSARFQYLFNICQWNDPHHSNIYVGYKNNFNVTLLGFFQYVCSFTCLHGKILNNSRSLSNGINWAHKSKVNASLLWYHLSFSTCVYKQISIQGWKGFKIFMDMTILARARVCMLNSRMNAFFFPKKNILH